MPLRRLGEYELLRKIGVGGMAEVWMGRRAALAGASKAVAIKLLARDVLDDESYRQMFIEEARLSMLLTHSNVVQVFDVGERDGECYMVMEWVDGLNLSELARKMQGQGEKLPTVVAAHVIGEVLRGLAYAHGLHHDGSKATIVHRDVSPQNVLVSVSGEVKLADFGVARLAREETSGLHVKGKLRYMAPEQLRGRSREPTVDLYAVGAILHELLEGTRFRQSRDEGDLYSMVLSGEYPPLSGDVPPVLVRLHAGLLEPDPKRRIQSADEALELLYSWEGYRNSSVELARLVRKWIGVAAPRSGILRSDIVAAVSTRELSGRSAAETLDVPTRQVGGRASSGSMSAVGDGSVVESGPIGERTVTETHTYADVPETDATAVIPDGGMPAAQRPISSALIGGAIALALSFGVFGLGFPLGWWGGGSQVAEAETKAQAQQAEQAEQAAVVEENSDSQVAIDPQPTSEPTREPTAGETGGAASGETGGETAGGETAGGETGGDPTGEPTGGKTGEGTTGETTDPIEKTIEPKSEPPKQLKHPPVSVLIKMPDFGYGWVRLGKQTILVETLQKEVQLVPGSYTVQFRQSEAEEWKRAGRVKIVPGKSQSLRIDKGPKASMQ